MFKKKSLYLMLALFCLGIYTIQARRLKHERLMLAQAKVIKPDELEKDEDETLDISTLQEEKAGGIDPVFVKEEEVKPVIKIDDFDSQTKRNLVKELVQAGSEYLKNNPEAVAFKEFTHSTKFTRGELYLFVFDTKGVCKAHGEQSDFIWKNLIDLRDSFGSPIVRAFIDKAQHGGGWITYNWNNATKVSYVTQVKKNGKEYIVGSGYYSHSKEDAVVNIVKGAVDLFNDLKAQGRSMQAFSAFNYPTGTFVFGNLYLFALNFNGIVMADGDRPGLVGSNGLDIQDEKGNFPNQEIIKKLRQTPDEGIWVTYYSKRALKKTYVQRVVDEQGNNYFLACGYWPDANRDKVVDLVKKGAGQMYAHGRNIAVQDFTNKTNEQFRYGPLYLTVYDLDGICLADGENADLIGQNLLDVKDEDGRLYVQELIKKGKQGGGWIDFKLKNSFESMYVELVDLHEQDYKYIVVSGIFPQTKSETAYLLVKSAASYLNANSLDSAMAKFTSPNGKYIRGDLDIFVFDVAGLCYAMGARYDLIWQNFLDAKDDDGKHYVKLFIDTAKQGTGKVTYRLNGFLKTGVVEQVEKDGKIFVIGSSYYK